MENDLPQPKANHSFWQNPIIVILSTMVLFFMTQIIGTVVALTFKPFIPNQNYQMLLFVAVNFIVFIGLLSIAMNIFKFNFKHIGLNKLSAKTYLRVVPAFFIYFAFSVSFTLFAERFIPGFNVEQTQDVGFSNVTARPELLAAFVSLVIITPIFEELIFRGILFRGLRRKIPFVYAAVLTSIVFAVAHLQWNVAIDTFALSLILCYLVEKSNSIVPSIFLHAFKNSLAFVLLFIVK